MTLILHITPRDRWEQARREGSYHGDTLDTEGFIHCSTPEQVLGPANALFRGQTGLVLLRIAAEQVGPEIRWEATPNGEVFPHIYGPLNTDAVTGVVDFPPRPDGTFVLPPEIAGMADDSSSA